jgi:hypothetical protein
MKTIALGLFLSLTGCMAAVGTQSLVNVPVDAPIRCARYCNDMKLSLSSVVIMANTVGCVCSPPISVSQGASGAVAGMAAVLMEEDEHKRR